MTFPVVQSTLDNSKLKNPTKNFELTNISNYQSSNYQRNRDKFEKKFELSNFIHMKIEKYNDKGMRGSLYLAHTRNLIVGNIISTLMKENNFTFTKDKFE